MQLRLDRQPERSLPRVRDARAGDAEGRRWLVWQDWLMLAELDRMEGAMGVSPVIRQYTWGLDLAGLGGTAVSAVGYAGHGGPALQAAGGLARCAVAH